MCQQSIKSVEEFIVKVKEVCKDWKSFPWFRGEPARAIIQKTQLLPKLYREKSDGTKHDENQLLQFFRMKAQSPQLGYTPDRQNTDQWLFLAQHVGLPTRLLDWTEGCLIALYFALIEEDNVKENKYKGDPVVWVLEPTEMNRTVLWYYWKNNIKRVPMDMKDYLLNNPSATLEDFINNTFAKEVDKYPSFLKENEFPVTWINGFSNANIRGAWESDKSSVSLPLAIHPTNIHPRLSVQKSCFTIHGKVKIPLNDLLVRLSPKYLEKCILSKFIIDATKIKGMLEDLRMMGISKSVLFPDLDGLASDLSKMF